ncbi:MAG: hypothetical protein IJ306_05975 [Oscillospiraceae bacterium]|nr:hypothetical protein [Oscillospiraceae bacterium]
MPNLEGMPCWFLGANAPKGYYSKFDQLFAAAPKGRCFLLKGGPGTGKSTVLKKTASVLKEKGVSTELVYCSADTNSLDAVITADGKFAVLDATLPHAVEPKYPGAYETTVSLCDCWNEEIIREHREKAVELFDANRRMHEEARRYIAAAANLLDEAARLGMESVHQEKVSKTAIRLCMREFGKKQHRSGTEKQRFLSAVTDKGVFFFNETPKILCDRVYVIDDDCGAASRIFMNTVRKTALEHGLDIITCRCPIFPSEKIEHIFIPSLRLGFMTANKRHKIEIAPYRIIHACRFTDEKKFARRRIKIRFALRAASRLIAEAADCMKEAKAVHDELEAIYIPAMNFSLVEEKYKKIIEAIG